MKEYAGRILGPFVRDLAASFRIFFELLNAPARTTVLNIPTSKRAASSSTCTIRYACIEVPVYVRKDSATADKSVSEQPNSSSFVCIRCGFELDNKGIE